METKTYVDKLREEYIAMHTMSQELDLLIGENNIEKRDITGYHGREIFELLQNADDAYQKSIETGCKPEQELQVDISYKHNVLTVSNTGTVFDASGIKAIVQGNNSTKSGKYIGNKGTGFRSVLNWADCVRIYSGEFAIEFSKEIAQDIFDQIKQSPQIQKQIDTQKKKGISEELHIPMLAVPLNIPDVKYDKTKTTIEILVDPEKQKDDFSVEKQLAEIDLRILLFLPNISQIRIETDENCTICRRKIIPTGFQTEINCKDIILKKIVDENVETKEEFYLFEKEIKDQIWESKETEKKDVRLAIAVPSDFEEFDCRHLYCYFPILDVEAPFNCVMHATYILGDQRNNLSPEPANKKIVKEQLLFLAEVAETLVANRKYEEAYKILLPKNHLSVFSRFKSTHFDAERAYIDFLKDKLLFRTVGGDVISLEMNPRMLQGEFPQVFRDEKIKNLLEPIQNREFIEFLCKTVASELGKQLPYSENELCSIINEKSEGWSAENRVAVFIWWNRVFDGSVGTVTVLPKLLRTETDRWLTYQSECYFLVGDFDANQIPKWTRVPVLKKEDQDELFRQSEMLDTVKQLKSTDEKQHISRIIARNNIYPLVTFQYQDKSNIIAAVNASVSTYEQSIEFVKWLWDNYSAEPEWKPPQKSEGEVLKTRYNFPCVQHNANAVADSTRLYFGKEYGNELAEELFVDRDVYAFPACEKFEIENRENFMNFVMKFGVKEFPEVIYTEDKFEPIDSYSRYYENEIQNEIKKQIGGSKRQLRLSYRLQYIANLDGIMSRMATSRILQWILRDHTLYSHLRNPNDSEYAYVHYQQGKMTNDRIYRGEVKNYILEFMNEFPWIEMNGRKYTPRQILNGFKGNINIDFCDVTPVLSPEVVEAYARAIGEECEKVREIFEIFDIKGSVCDLDSKQFYSVMLRLSELENAELMKKVYRVVERKTDIKKYEDCQEKKDFIKNGKLLVEYEGREQFWKATETYLPSTRIISKRKLPIVKKGQRTNNKNFQVLFGCQEYNKEYQIIPESIRLSPADDSFQRYYEAFLPYAKVYRETNKNIDDCVDDLQITLVREIKVNEGGNVRAIDEPYTCIRDNNSITKWYIPVFDDTFKKWELSENLELIFANIANTPGFNVEKIGNLFRTPDRAERNFLIKKEFGSLDVLQDTNRNVNLEEKYLEAMQQLDASYTKEKLEMDDIDFQHFSLKENVRKILQSLRKINKDICDLRQAGFMYHIDVQGYFEGELNKYITNNLKNYENALYEKAKMDEGLQQQFIQKIYDFENCKVGEITNPATFDVEKYIKEIFGEWEPTDTDARGKYEEYYYQFNPDKEFEDVISNDEQAQRMIYFGKADEFRAWIAEKKKQTEGEGKEMDPYAEFRNVIPEMVNLAYHENAEDYWQETGYADRKTAKGSYVSGNNGLSNEKLIGNKGELLVYNYLCNKYTKNKVRPRSEAFRQMGILAAGLDKSGDYDLSYEDEDGKLYYVEVKTGDGCSFFMSEGELAFAKKYPDNYKVMYVYILHNQPKISEMPLRFWEDDRYKRHDIIKSIEYRF